MSSFSFNTFPYYAFSASTFLLLLSFVFLCLHFYPVFFIYFSSSTSIFFFSFSISTFYPLPIPFFSASSSSYSFSTSFRFFLHHRRSSPSRHPPLPRSGTKRRLGFPRDAGGRATLLRPRRIRAVILLCHESGDVTYYMIV